MVSEQHIDGFPIQPWHPELQSDHDPSEVLLEFYRTVVCKGKSVEPEEVQRGQAKNSSCDFPLSRELTRKTFNDICCFAGIREKLNVFL